MSNRNLAWSVRPPVATQREINKWSTNGHTKTMVATEDGCGLLLYGIILRMAEDLAMLRVKGFWRERPEEMKGRRVLYKCMAGHYYLRGDDLLRALNDPNISQWCEYLSAWLGRTIDKEWIVRRARLHDPDTWLRKSGGRRAEGGELRAESRGMRDECGEGVAA